MRNARALQRIAIILAVLFALSLLPVMAVAFYNHPRADDYTYGAVLRKVIDAGQGLPEAVAAIAAYVRSTYAHWQGSFSAVMLFTLQPGVFSDNAYWLTTALTLLPLLLGTGMLLRQLGKMLHAPRTTVVLIFLALMTLSIQLVPDLNQTFYWFNGGCYYTFYYALSLMLLTGTLRICTDGKCRAGRTVLCMALAFFIGGGNYTTILVTLILLMLLLLALLVRKKPAWRQILLVMVALLTAFAINAAAPGNRVRAATIPRSMDAIPAILYSFDRAWARVSGWFGWPQGIAIALFALLMWDFVGQCGLEFRFPLLKSALAYAIFSAQMTPSLFAMANVGPGRQIDIYYYAYGWLLLCWTFLWVGWLRNSRIGTKIDAALSHLTRHSAAIAAALSLALVLTLPSAHPTSGAVPTSVAAAKALISGEAQTYHQQYTEILQTLRQPGEICEIPDVVVCPAFLNPLGLADEGQSCYWVNQALANYFGHQQVIRIEQTP